ISGVGSDFGRISVARHNDFVMSGVPADAVSVRQIRVGSLDDSERRIHAIGVAPIYSDHAELLNRNGQFSARAIQRNAPALVGYVQMTLGFEIATRVVIEYRDAIFDVVIDGVNLTAFGINFDSGNEADLGLRANDLPHGRG